MTTTITPAGAAMSRDELAAWLRLRGVDDGAWMDELVALYAGCTEDQMDAVYDEMHG